MAKFPDVDWYCDWCGAKLSNQPGFSDDCGSWKCTECGRESPIISNNIFDSHEEYWELHLANDFYDEDDENDDDDDDDY